MIQARRAVYSDLELYFNWRNDSVVRKSAFSSDPVSLPQHEKWFSGRVGNENSFLYVIEVDSIPAGQVRFEVSDSIAEINYSIASDFRGKGLAVSLMSTAVTAFYEEASGIEFLRALVKSENIASNKVFEKLGFRLESTESDVNKYILTTTTSSTNEAQFKSKVMSRSEKLKINIAGRSIGKDFPPYIIAEMSANHNGSLEKAFEIISMAKKAGADAIKLQTYKPDTITMDCDSEDFKIKGGLWDGQTLYELYEKAHMPWEWHKPLFEKAKEIGITIFSSPFDFTAVDLLEELNAPAYKIASFEAIDIPLIKYVAKTGKPMIISTGMATEIEIQEAIIAAREGGCRDLVVLHCVSGYPAPSADYNLRTITDMKEKFGALIGLSDHTIENTTAVASVALGACMIEKHVTLDRKGGGPDDSFSLEPNELAELCRDAKIVWEALGKVNYERKKSEEANLVFRRSLYVVKDINAGEQITHENVKSIRPGYGIPPKHLDDVLGNTAKEDISRGTALQWDLLE